MISNNQLSNLRQHLLLEQSLGLIRHLKVEDVAFIQRQVDVLKTQAEGKTVATNTPERYSADNVKTVGNLYLVPLVNVVAKAEREIEHAQRLISHLQSAIPGNTIPDHETIFPYDNLTDAEFLEYARKEYGDETTLSLNPEEYPSEVITYFEHQAIVPLYLAEFHAYKKRKLGRALIAQWKELLNES